MRIHPYELSYYNELIGGPRGAWERGFELTYWYDAFTDKVIDDLNASCRRSRGRLSQRQDQHPSSYFRSCRRWGPAGDIFWLSRQTDHFPYVWLLTQDSKATAFTRLLFAMRPGTRASRAARRGAGRLGGRPGGGLARLGVADPSRWQRQARRPPAAPAWVQLTRPVAGPALGRRTDASSSAAPLQTDVLDWSRSDPEGLLAAARRIAAKQAARRRRGGPATVATDDQRSRPEVCDTFTTRELLHARPEALVEAIQMLNAHRDEVKQ